MFRVTGGGSPKTGKAKSVRIEHRLPTEATAKQLYWTAFRCGKPDCTKPLFRVSDETGKMILNSRVAHIHARRQDGPRWDAAMSEADNRSAANLIPMCMEHAYEIDVTPQHYPAELLREWKQIQLTEYQQVHNAWPLNDQQAAEVIEVSFGAYDFGMANAGASAVLAAARAVGHLAETARQQRWRPREAAQAWNALRVRVNMSMPGIYDGTTGERLTVEPSMMETAPYREALQTSLAEAVAMLQPLAATVVADLHAVRATDQQLIPWCDWVEAVTADVITASSRWPGPTPTEDDDTLSNALAELHRASTALSSVWRKEDAERPPPPPPPVAEPVETEQQRAGREHRELLEMARRWARVDNLPFDSDLYVRLVQAASYAIGLPPLPRTLTCDLNATTRLAAKVARNADDDTYVALIEQAAELHPLAVAVALLRDLMRTAEDAGRQDLSAKTKEDAFRLLEAEGWRNLQVWTENEFYVKLLLGLTAEVTSHDQVQHTIATALDNNSDLLPRILDGIVQWSEQRSIDDFSNVLGIRRLIGCLPLWIPAQRIVDEIREQLPDLTPAADEDDDGHHDTDFRRFAAHVLRVASSGS